MDLEFRFASQNDLPVIVRMLADDHLGAEREEASEPLHESYLTAFDEIDSDPNNELIVAERDGMVVGTLQLTFTPSLSSQGGKRCTVESVRVDAAERSNGIGREMMIWAIERAREKGCISMQLTSHRSRDRSHAFYEKLGFKSSHVGMKLKLK